MRKQSTSLNTRARRCFQKTSTPGALAVAPLLFILHRNKFLIRPGELPQGDPDRLSDEKKNLIVRICTALGETTGIGTELSERVCSEDPWLHARGNLKPCDTGGDTLIPKIAMGVYYFEHPILH